MTHDKVLLIFNVPIYHVVLERKRPQELLIKLCGEVLNISFKCAKCDGLGVAGTHTRVYTLHTHENKLAKE